jgi:hypothetical protein
LQASQQLAAAEQRCAILAKVAEEQAASLKQRIRGLEAEVESITAELCEAKQAHAQACSTALGQRKALADEVEVLKRQLHNRGLHLEAQAGKVLLFKQVR